MFLFVCLHDRRPPETENQLNEVMLLATVVDGDATAQEKLAELACREMRGQVVVRVVAGRQRRALCTDRPTAEALAAPRQTLHAVRLRAARTFLRNKMVRKSTKIFTASIKIDID